MKKLLLISSLVFAVNANAVNIELGDCVLIKEDKLSLYLDKDKVEEFLSQPYNEEVIDKGVKYTIELQNKSQNKRKKMYKVCAISKIKQKEDAKVNK